MTFRRPRPGRHALAEHEAIAGQLGDRLDRDRPLLGPGDGSDVGVPSRHRSTTGHGRAPAGPSAAPAARRNRCRSTRRGPAARPSRAQSRPGRCGIPRSCSGRRRSPGSCRSRASGHRGRPASPPRPAAALAGKLPEDMDVAGVAPPSSTNLASVCSTLIRTADAGRHWYLSMKNIVYQSPFNQLSLSYFRTLLMADGRYFRPLRFPEQPRADRGLRSVNGVLLCCSALPSSFS